jgi:hypothetical protein
MVHHCLGKPSFWEEIIWNTLSCKENQGPWTGNKNHLKIGCESCTKKKHRKSQKMVDFSMTIVWNRVSMIENLQKGMFFWNLDFFSMVSTNSEIKLAWSQFLSKILVYNAVAGLDRSLAWESHAAAFGSGGESCGLQSGGGGTRPFFGSEWRDCVNVGDAKLGLSFSWWVVRMWANMGLINV